MELPQTISGEKIAFAAQQRSMFCGLGEEERTKNRKKKRKKKNVPHCGQKWVG